MDVRTLYTLLAIADHKSFAAAGRAVGLSPAGVSLQIKGLESELGLRLFDRTARPPAPTEDCGLVVRRARELVGVWERLSADLRPQAAAGVLDLGAVPTLVSGILPQALRRLRNRNPGLQIRLSTGLSHVLVGQVRSERLDAALLAQPEALDPGLTWTAFCQEPLMVVAPADLPGDDDRALLTAAPFIRFKPYAWAGRAIDEALRQRGIEVRAGMEVDSLEGILELVANGLGVAVLPRRNLANPFPDSVRAVPFGEPAMTRALGLLRRPNAPRADLLGQLTQELTALST